jgi:hypothetical protein
MHLSGLHRCGALTVGVDLKVFTNYFATGMASQVCSENGCTTELVDGQGASGIRGNIQMSMVAWVRKSIWRREAVRFYLAVG